MTLSHPADREVRETEDQAAEDRKIQTPRLRNPPDPENRCKNQLNRHDSLRENPEVFLRWHKKDGKRKCSLLTEPLQWFYNEPND